MDRDRKKTADSDPHMIDTAEAAMHLRVHVGTVRRYVTEGKMPSPDSRHGRRMLWVRTRFLSWLEGRDEAQGHEGVA